MSCSSSYKTSINRTDKDAALKAVMNISDINTLKDVAIKAYYSNIRAGALKRIDDQAFLKDRFEKDPKIPIKFLLAKKITDKIFLAKQAMNKYLPESIRMICAKKIINQDVLIKIVKTTRNVTLARYTAGRITRKNAALILKNIKDSNYLGSATIPILMGKIKDLKVLKSLSLNRSSYKVRKEAKKQIRHGVKVNP